jgi:cobalt-zinc-cadmium efflux system protein
MVFANIRAAIAATPGVTGVHDLHVWVSGADEPSCSAHVELAADANPEAVRTFVTTTLADRFDLRHVTIQTEREPCEDRDHLHI